MSGCVDHHHDHEPKDSGDPDGAKRPVPLVVEHDRATAREDERKCREGLGKRAPRQ
jgi:hypothetical protein